MNAPDRVVLSRGCYWLLAPVDASPAPAGGDGQSMHRIVDAGGATVEYVAGIDAGFLRIEQLLATDRNAGRSAASTLDDAAALPIAAHGARRR